MEKKVDLAALVGGAVQNSTTERAPLADGSVEETAAEKTAPFAPDVTEAKQPEAPYEDLNTPENAGTPTVPGIIPVSLDQIAADGVQFGVDPVVQAAPAAPTSPVSKQLTEIEALTKLVGDLTKRLEDFGALPRQVDNKPHVPVVTKTKAGNIRTDW